MGPCMSLCESTPDVPKNIIADPEVRRTRARAMEDDHHPRHRSIRSSIHPRHHPFVAWVLSNDDDDDDDDDDDARESRAKD